MHTYLNPKGETGRKCVLVGSINFVKTEKMNAIIFDLVGVVMNLNIERDTAALHSVGLPDYVGCLANEGIRTPMEAYLNGLIPKQEFLEGIRPFCREGVTDSEILWSMDAVLDDIPRERIEKIIRLKEKYRVFLLSNLYDTAWEHTLREFVRAGYSPSHCFERVFLSQKLGMAKPDPRIFLHVVEETGIEPSETFFFDDTKANIESANALGFRSVLVPMNRVEEVLKEIF